MRVDILQDLENFQLLRKEIEAVVKSSEKLWEVIFDGKNKGTKEKETIEIRDEEDTLPDIKIIEKSNVEKIVVAINIPSSFS